MKSKIEWIRKAQRCLRMLSELHRLGYQNLRGMPYMNPLGFRFAIAPKDCFAENGIAIPAARLGGDNEYVAITGAGEYFGWSDTSDNDARALAEKFVERFPAIATKGKGRDWEYAGWLSELVGFLEGGDMVPICWWENMKGQPEDLRTLPIWIDGQDNFEWIEIESLISSRNPVFPLPSSKVPLFEHWGQQRYWTDALDAIGKHRLTAWVGTLLDHGQLVMAIRTPTDHSPGRRIADHAKIGQKEFHECDPGRAGV